MYEPQVWLALAGLAALGYAIGSLSAGYIVGRLRGGIDLRAVGSGSTGATNALRSLGPRLAAIVAVLDIAKGAIAVLLAGQLTGDPGAQAAAGLGAVAGHSWPIGLRGRGGRGMTPAVGATLVIVPQVAPIALAAFAGAIAITRTASVGSLAAVTGTIIGYLTLSASGLLRFDGAQLVFLGGTAVIVFIRHRENIGRLLAGREPPIGSRAASREGGDQPSRKAT